MTTYIDAMAAADTALSTFVADELDRGDLVGRLAPLDAEHRIPILFGMILALDPHSDQYDVADYIGGGDALHFRVLQRLYGRATPPARN